MKPYDGSRRVESFYHLPAALPVARFESLDQNHVDSLLILHRPTYSAQVSACPHMSLEEALISVWRQALVRGS